MRSPTHSTVRREIACDKASKSNIEICHQFAQSAKGIRLVEVALDVSVDGLLQSGEAAVITRALQPTETMLKDRGYNFFEIIGELGSKTSIVQAQQELNAIAAHIPLDKSRGPVRFRATSYQELLTGPVRPVLYALFGALGLVLLIACANVSNLLISRCLGRLQEFTLRVVGVFDFHRPLMPPSVRLQRAIGESPATLR